MLTPIEGGRSRRGFVRGAGGFVRRVLLLAGVAGLTAGASVATGAEPTSPNAVEVGSVIITAEKRSQSLQKAPLAITAFTAKQRDLMGIETLQDITDFTPGLTYTSADHLYMRGVGRQSIDLAADAGIASYNDGFYNPEPVLIVLPSMFAKSIEIQRGPQGTFSGRNGIGGSIDVESVRPTDTLYGEARETIGNYGRYQTELALSGPLAHGLGLRVAGYQSTQTEGYYKNLAGGSEGGRINDWYFESALAAKFGDRADLYLHAYTFGKNDQGGGAGSRDYANRNPYSTNIVDYSSPAAFNAAAGYNAALITPGSLVQANNSLTGNPATANEHEFASNVPERQTIKNTGDINAVFTYRFPTFDVKYTGGYAQYQYDNTLSNETPGPTTDVISYQLKTPLNPGCNTPGQPTCLTVYPTLKTHYKQTDSWYSHELVLASTNNAPLQWIGGVYYYDERYTNPISVTMPPQQLQPQAPYYFGLSLTPAPLNPTNALLSYGYSMEEKSKAVFGQVDWTVTKTLKFTAGLRYTDDSKSGSEYSRTVLFGGSGEYSTIYGALVPQAEISTLMGAPFHYTLSQAQTAVATGAVPGPVVAGAQAYAAGQAAGLTTGIAGANTPAIDLTPNACALAVKTRGATSACTVNPATGMASRGLAGNSSATTGTAGVEWTPDASTLVYLRYSRGYKELALNAGKLSSMPEANPEHLNDYELGLKKAFGRDFVLDANLFYEDYQDFQASETFLTTTGQVATQFVSIPKSRSDGLEVEAVWTPVKHLQLRLAYAYDDSAILTGSCNPAAPKAGACYIDVSNPNLGAQSLQGHQLPNTPKNKVALNGAYTFLFDAGSLTLSGSYIWRDVQYGDIFNQSYWQAAAWSTVNLRATWKSANDRYEVVAYGANVGDTDGYSSGGGAVQYGNAQTGAYTTLRELPLNPPATYGLELHYRFF